jgi:hypothetical protein
MQRRRPRGTPAVSDRRTDATFWLSRRDRVRLRAGGAVLARASLGGSAGVVIPFQGRVDLDGTPVSGVLGMAFDIYNGTGGVPAATPCDSYEPADPVPVAGGQFTVLIHDVAESCVAGKEVYVGVRITPAGGGAALALAGRQRIYPMLGALTSGPGDFAVAGKLTAPTAQVNEVHLGYVDNTQGTHITWKRSAGSGATDFVNHRGGGAGGFNFENTANGTSLTRLMTLDGSGNLNVPGSVSAGSLSTGGNLSVSGTIRGASYGFGGMYSTVTTDAGAVCGFGGAAVYDVNNPITGGLSYPSGFTATPIAYVDVCWPNVGPRRKTTFLCWK